MSRVETHDPKTIKNPETKKLLDEVQKSLGRIPNMFLAMANSPAILKGYLALNQAVNGTSLPPELREEISLAVSQANNCNYCLSAHSAIAKGLKVSEDDILSARKGESKDSKRKAILLFAKKTIEKKGHVSENDVNELKKAGINDQELTEIILVINTSIFTNYFNSIVDTKNDFEEVKTFEFAEAKNT